MKTRSSWGVLICIVAFPAWPLFAEENHLPNGDAEQGEAGRPPPHWVPFGYDGASHPTDFPLKTVEGGRNGSRALRFGCPTGYVWTYVQQYIPLRVDQTRRAVFSAWLRSDRSIQKVGFHLYLTPKGQKEGGHSRRSDVAVGTTWQRYEIAMDFALVETPESQAYCLRPIVQLYSRGSHIELDDATITIVAGEITPEQKAKLEVCRAVLPPGAVTVRSPVGVAGGIVAGDDGRLLAFTSDFGVRVSADGGKTWSAREALAIDDKFDRITGAIRMSNGTIGIHTESWSKPMYFWKSADRGRTWSKRIQIGPKGAPLHGNVMIETSAASQALPSGWRKHSCSEAGTHDSRDSKSALRKARGGASGRHAAVLTLGEADEWMYAQGRLSLDRALMTGDEYVLRAKVQARKEATFDLYFEAWDSKERRGSRARRRFKATPDWQTYEVKLAIPKDAHGLKTSRIIVQLYTPGVELLVDDVEVERLAPAKDAGPLTVTNPSFEQGPIGRLVIPVREGHTVHSGLWKDAYAGGTVRGKFVKTEGHAHAMEMDITFVYYSTDGGSSWRRSQGDIIIWKDNGYGGMWPVDEPCVAQLKDGRLLMLARTTLGRLYQTFSRDGGVTWDYPTPTDLPSSYSPCSLRRVPENEWTVKTGRAGDLVCVWNNVSNDEIKRGFRRGRLSVAVSTDDANTWRHIKTIDTAGLPVISGAATLSLPGMVRARKDLGELPFPFGTVHYPDITFFRDKVLIKYAKRFRNPELSVGTLLHILPIDWLYEG